MTPRPDYAPSDATLDYGRAKSMAQSADPQLRRRVAGSSDVPPELLFYLANDKAPAVRREISRNTRTPRQADLLLACDQDPEVRSGLARKIARIASDLPRERLDQLERVTADPGGFNPSWANAGSAEAAAGAPAETPAETPINRARRLKKEGKLDEAAVAASLSEGNRAFTVAALAELAGTEMLNVDRVLASHSARAVVALVWKSELSMKIARQVQLRLAQIPPKQVLAAREGSAFPLSDKDMIWQLEFFGIA